MTTTAYSGTAARPMAGWIVFAAAMMMVIGSIDFIEGLIAVIRKQYYVVGPNQVIIFNMEVAAPVGMPLAGCSCV